MNIIALQHFLEEAEFSQLNAEFSQYEFKKFDQIEEHHLEKVEVLFGNSLSEDLLPKLPRLRWVHSPTGNVHNLCLDAIMKQGRIIISHTKGLNARQMAEFAFSAILAFSKNLFYWEKKECFENSFSDPVRKHTKTLQNSTLLIIGLGSIGMEIASFAKAFNMQIWGVDEKASFHPFCHQVFSYYELESVLPAADIICVTTSIGVHTSAKLASKELSLIHNDAILIVLNSDDSIDISELEDFLSENPLKGVVLDMPKNSDTTSSIWKSKNLITTPDIADLPKTQEKQEFHTFRYNLRLYASNNLSEMKDVINFEETSV